MRDTVYTITKLYVIVYLLSVSKTRTEKIAISCQSAPVKINLGVSEIRNIFFQFTDLEDCCQMTLCEQVIVPFTT